MSSSNGNSGNPTNVYVFLSVLFHCDIEYQIWKEQIKIFEQEFKIYGRDKTEISHRRNK
jgi:hypothetical protein